MPGATSLNANSPLSLVVVVFKSAVTFSSNRYTFFPACGRGSDPCVTTPLMAPAFAPAAATAAGGSTSRTSPVASVARPTPLITRTPTAAGPFRSAIGSTAVNSPALVPGTARNTLPRTAATTLAAGGSPTKNNTRSMPDSGSAAVARTLSGVPRTCSSGRTSLTFSGGLLSNTTVRVSTAGLASSGLEPVFSSGSLAGSRVFWSGVFGASRRARRVRGPRTPVASRSNAQSLTTLPNTSAPSGPPSFKVMAWSRSAGSKRRSNVPVPERSNPKST